MRLGPVALTFAGVVKFEEIDDANHTRAGEGAGQRRQGPRRRQCHAPRSGSSRRAAGSKVLVHTDLTLSGAVAQYGRGVGMIQATAAQIMNQFANNLKAQIGAADRAADSRDRRPRRLNRHRRPTADLGLLAHGQGDLERDQRRWFRSDGFELLAKPIGRSATGTAVMRFRKSSTRSYSKALTPPSWPCRPMYCFTRSAVSTTFGSYSGASSICSRSLRPEFL